MEQTKKTITLDEPTLNRQRQNDSFVARVFGAAEVTYAEHTAKSDVRKDGITNYNLIEIDHMWLCIKPWREHPNIVIAEIGTDCPKDIDKTDKVRAIGESLGFKPKDSKWYVWRYEYEVSDFNDTKEFANIVKQAHKMLYDMLVTKISK